LMAWTTTTTSNEISFTSCDVQFSICVASRHHYAITCATLSSSLGVPY
jgi:hypothetical protein